MSESTIAEIMKLKKMPLDELQKKYKEVFESKEMPSSNKVLLWRKIAYRLQELEYGGLSNDTKNRINELIERYDPINNKMLRPQKALNKVKGAGRDTRLPIPGAIIRKEYKGQILEVKVLEKGFEYQGQAYRTLSAVATAVTGIHWNGYLFFKP
ncbi:MAG: DUF2924 domain-containing protein [Candidatus Aceula meridiana]|nr:DUF2924 domain-containing protein [Candidatus Aceula meridiana]